MMRFSAALVMLMLLSIVVGDAFAASQDDTTTQEIKNIQTHLTLIGYTLTVDGKNGAETQKALTTFTQDFNVSPKGDVTDLSGHILSYYADKISYYGAIAKTNSDLRGIVTGAIVVGKKPFREWVTTQTKCNGENTTHITKAGTRSQKIECYLNLLTAYQARPQDAESETATTQSPTDTAESSANLVETVPATSDDTTTASSTAFDTRFTGRTQDIAAMWTPEEGCACVPNLSTVTYGFYPLASEGLAVNFGLFSRIGYDALIPDSFGNLDEPSTVALRAFTQTAHRYGTKVDLVIRHDNLSPEPESTAPREPEPSEGSSNTPRILERSYVLLNLIDEIVTAVEHCECDGVTIDFSTVPPTLKERYRFFVKRLYKRLKERDQRLSLNVVIPNFIDGVDPAIVIETLKEDLTHLSPSVDLFLADWPMKDAMNAALGDLALNIEVAPVLSGENITRTNYELVRNNFSGVGIWNLSTKPSEWEPLLRTEVDRTLEQVELGTVKRQLPIVICNLVCPNRDIVRLILFTVFCLILALYISSFWIYELRELAKRYIYIVIAAFVFVVVLLWLLALCVPLWTGIRTELTIALLGGLFALVIKATQDKKQAANYP